MVLSSEDIERLRHELRNDETGDMRRRRWIIGLSLVGAGAMGVVALF